jgi:hypothetical protein
MMAKFDYCNFNDGIRDTEFVVHAKKYTKEEAIDLCLQENYWIFNEEYRGGKPLRKPTLDDVIIRHVRHYVEAPYFVDWDGAVYTYCPANEKGSFPVWVIEFEELMMEKAEYGISGCL